MPSQSIAVIQKKALPSNKERTQFVDKELPTEAHFSTDIVAPNRESPNTEREDPKRPNGLAEKGTANVEEIQRAEHATNRISTHRERSPQTVDIKICQKREFASNRSATSKPILQKTRVRHQ